MKKEIIKMDPVSLMKLYGAIYGTIGLLLGFFLALMSLLGAFADTNSLPFAGFGFLSIIIFPIFYGLIGVLFGAIGAILYNFFAQKVGGIKIELKDTQF